MTDLRRREALLLPGLLLPGLLPARPARAADMVLRVGDQRGNVRAVMEAAGVLKSVPYTIEWSEFVAAAPLLEALRAGAVELGYAGDAPSTFAFANGVPMRVVAATRSPAHGTAIVVAGSSPIKDGPGLRGHTVATGRGSIGHSCCWPP